MLAEMLGFNIVQNLLDLANCLLLPKLTSESEEIGIHSMITDSFHLFKIVRVSCPPVSNPYP